MELMSTHSHTTVGPISPARISDTLPLDSSCDDIWCCVQFKDFDQIWLTDSVHNSLQEGLRRASFVLSHFADQVRLVTEAGEILEDADKEP